MPLHEPGRFLFMYDKLGNGWADALASEGLAMLHAPAQAWRRHKFRAAQARALQAVMVDVVEARDHLLAEQAAAGAATSASRAELPTSLWRSRTGKGADLPARRGAPRGAYKLPAQ